MQNLTNSVIIEGYLKRDPFMHQKNLLLTLETFQYMDGDRVDEYFQIVIQKDIEKHKEFLKRGRRVRVFGYLGRCQIPNETIVIFMDDIEYGPDMPKKKV